jgi:hypothetical protein
MCLTNPEKRQLNRGLSVPMPLPRKKEKSKIYLIEVQRVKGVTEGRSEPTPPGPGRHLAAGPEQI